MPSAIGATHGRNPSAQRLSRHERRTRLAAPATRAGPRKASPPRTVRLQHRRTPAGRRELRFMDEQIAKLDFELRVSDTEAVRRALEADGRAVSQDEVERAQQQTLEELRTGELGYRVDRRPRGAVDVQPA